MGVWGTEPFESDDSLDWFSENVEGSVLQAIHTALLSDNWEESWERWYGAASLLTRMQGLVYGDSDEVRLAIERVRELIRVAPEMGWSGAGTERSFVSNAKTLGRKLRSMQRAGRR